MQTDKGSIYSAAGLDAEKLIAYQQRTGTIVGFPGSEPINSEDFWTVETEFLVPAAFEGQITAKNAPRIRARFVIEGANGPTTPEADDILHDRGILVVPDVIANAGGVTVSYFEWVQDFSSFFWSEAEINARLDRIMLEALHGIGKWPGATRSACARRHSSSPASASCRRGSCAGCIRNTAAGNVSTTLNIIGCGRVGRTLGRLWRKNGVFKIGDVTDHTPEKNAAAVAAIGGGRAVASIAAMHSAELWMLTTRDDQITRACSELAASGRLTAGAIVFHCSGTLTARDLAPAAKLGARVASVHPLKTFAGTDDARGLEGVYLRPKAMRPHWMRCAPPSSAWARRSRKSIRATRPSTMRRA